MFEGHCPYGQTFRSVRDGLNSALRHDLPKHAALLPKGLKKPRRSSPRLKGFDYIGAHAYSITANTDGFRPYFSDPRFTGFCVKTLLNSASSHEFEVLAYCLMPNHVHLLVQGLAEPSQLKPFLKHFKQITGFAFKQERGVHLWHRSYHDRIARKEDDLPSAAAYIWGNPVRAGLVEFAEDYPYSGPAERLGRGANVDRDQALGGQTLKSVRTVADASVGQGSP